MSYQQASLHARTCQIIADAFVIQATSPIAAVRQSWRQRGQRLSLVLQSQGPAAMLALLMEPGRSSTIP